MKIKFILAICLSISLMFCSKKSPEVKHLQTKEISAKDLKNIVVVNEEDPVCHMKTEEFLKDTAVFNNKIYGFCSISCKNKFKKNPSQYVTK